jgi:hypothetical protein
MLNLFLAEIFAYVRFNKWHVTTTMTWSPLKTGGEFRCSGRVSSSCSTSGTRRVTNPVISREGPESVYDKWNISVTISTKVNMSIICLIIYTFRAIYFLCWILSDDNTTDATSGAGTLYPSGAPEFTPGFSCYSIFSFILITSLVSSNSS